MQTSKLLGFYDYGFSTIVGDQGPSIGYWNNTDKLYLSYSFAPASLEITSMFGTSLSAFNFSGGTTSTEISWFNPLGIHNQHMVPLFQSDGKTPVLDSKGNQIIGNEFDKDLVKNLQR